MDDMTITDAERAALTPDAIAAAAARLGLTLKPGDTWDVLAHTCCGRGAAAIAMTGMTTRDDLLAALQRLARQRPGPYAALWAIEDGFEKWGEVTHISGQSPEYARFFAVGTALRATVPAVLLDDTDCEEEE